MGTVFWSEDQVFVSAYPFPSWSNIPTLSLTLSLISLTKMPISYYSIVCSKMHSPSASYLTFRYTRISSVYCFLLHFFRFLLFFFFSFCAVRLFRSCLSPLNFCSWSCCSLNIIAYPYSC